MSPVHATAPSDPAPSDSGSIRLGLIGDNIAGSRSPRLHALAGGLVGTPVRYDRLVPPELGQDFEAVFSEARAGGYRGLNITYPYKERVVPLLTMRDARVARLGAVNTVLFAPGGPEGYNTDWSGFMAGYRRVRGVAPAGTVCMIGAGGVGRAIAFALLELGLDGLRLVDRDLAKARALAEALRRATPDLAIAITPDAVEGAYGANGIVNCTPVGMTGHDGTPLPAKAMAGAAWAFDAVYTPVATRFLGEAAAAGLEIISGEELFFYQGLHAVRIFHGRDVGEAELRRAMAENGA